jgi:ribonuclease P protein component
MVEDRPNQSSRDLDSSSPLPNGLNLSLGRDRRVTRSAHFKETFAQQKKYVGRSMVLWLRSGEEADLRIGIITSKKVSLRANKRNRARRVLRESFRHTRPYLQGEVDLILVARKSILNRSYSSIRAELISLCTQAGLLTPSTEETLLKKLAMGDHDA